MKRQFIIFSGLIFGILSLYSQQVSFEEAGKTAQIFFGKSQKSMQACADIAVKNNDTLFYVFNANDGFVVVSAEKKTIPVLAYSDEGAYDAANVIPPVRMWLDYYQSQIAAIRKDAGFLPEEKVSRSWAALENASKSHKSTNPSMEPLLTSKWDQTRYYNYYCPLDALSNNNGRAITGCVATAMAQLMYYFRFPQQGTGSYTYTHDVYGIISEDFSQATYDYSAMTDEPKEINGDISLLSYHCGVAVDMVYGPNSSGMYNHKAAYAMKTYFGFSDQTQYLYRDSTLLNWDSVIVAHLDNKIPLYYAGWSDSVAQHEHVNGHAFICDAYQVDSNDNYYYHFNFGWSGYADGNFYTGKLYPSSNDFTLGQELIINAYPDTVLYDYPDPITNGSIILKSEAGSFTNGSIYNCPEKIDYTWIIRPEVEILRTITLILSYELAQGDSIIIFVDGQINNVLTADTSQIKVSTTAKEVSVRFVTTNDATTSKKIKGKYTTEHSDHCGNSGVQYTDKQGSFNDGSGAYRYNNLTYCGKRINVPGAKSVTLRFSKFETEKDKDILSIFDNAKNLLLTLSGSLADFDSTEMTFQTNNILELIFETDRKNIFDGWELTYITNTSTGMEDLSASDHFLAYPNPVTDYLHVKMENSLPNTQIQLFDIYGKLIQEQTLADEQSIIDMNNLASGVYLLKVKENTKTIITKKIIKQ